MRPIDLIAKTRLIDGGFKLVGTTWYRATGEVLQLINFQCSSWSKKYYLNTAIIFCDKSLKELGRILPKEYQCPIQWRSEMLPETVQYVFALDFEEDIPDDIRNKNILSLLDYWLSFFDKIKTQEEVLKKIEDNTIDKTLIFYSFIKEHKLI